MSDSQDHQNDEDLDETEINNCVTNNANRRSPSEQQNENSGSSHEAQKIKADQSRPHSRCDIRSRLTKQMKPWKSVNPFINFIQDFRQRFPGTKSSNILRLAGEEWRHLTVAQKQPYIDAAKVVRLQKQARQQRQEVEQKQERKEKRERQQRQHREKKQRRQKSYQKQGKWQNITNYQKHASGMVSKHSKISLDKQSKKVKKAKKHGDGSLTNCSDAEPSGITGSLASEDMTDFSS